MDQLSTLLPMQRLLSPARWHARARPAHRKCRPLRQWAAQFYLQLAFPAGGLTCLRLPELPRQPKAETELAYVPLQGS